jgi:hypothetical protein
MSTTDRTIHIVIARFRGAPVVVERALADSDYETTLADIMSGEIEEVVQILACNPVEHTCDDVTEDMAIDIAHRVAGPIRQALYDFIERAAGLDYARGLTVIDRTFAVA